jgi:radical SAM/Cys-rich protein
MQRPEFHKAVACHAKGPLRRGTATTLQVNVGWRCDLACHHCHVEAGPKRTEMMDERTAERVLTLLARNPSLATLDLTGGAPELHACFRPLVRGARALGRAVIDRCNLTVLLEPGQQDTPAFLASERVKLVASLPCYTKENVEQQRGRDVFDRSIEALRILNRHGFGEPGSGLDLDLVYNPLGPTLPPAQAELESRYREELRTLFGVEFSHLVTITNMPIRRFAHALARDGRHEAYMGLRSLISVRWDGRLYDCDFNQMQELELGGRPRTIWDVEDLTALEDDEIATAAHCFGCTAGNGSSCGGALA